MIVFVFFYYCEINFSYIEVNIFVIYCLYMIQMLIFLVLFNVFYSIFLKCLRNKMLRLKVFGVYFFSFLFIVYYMKMGYKIIILIFVFRKIIK